MAEKLENSQTGGEIAKNQEESPYVLYSSDHPGLIFVTTPFTGENFASWKNSMETALYAKSKGSFIDGSLPTPSTSSSEFPRWKKNDAMVKAWIRNSLTKDIQESVVYAETAHEIWKGMVRVMHLACTKSKKNSPTLIKKMGNL